MNPINYMLREWAPTQLHNLSVTGKAGRTDFNVSLGYLGPKRYDEKQPNTMI